MLVTSGRTGPCDLVAIGALAGTRPLDFARSREVADALKHEGGVAVKPGES